MDGLTSEQQAYLEESLDDQVRHETDEWVEVASDLGPRMRLRPDEIPQTSEFDDGQPPPIPAMPAMPAIKLRVGDEVLTVSMVALRRALEAVEGIR